MKLKLSETEVLKIRVDRAFDHQRKLAEASGVHESDISRILRGRREPTKREKEKLELAIRSREVG